MTDKTQTPARDAATPATTQPTAPNCTKVFHFASRDACTARPCRPQYDRNTLINASRTETSATGNHQNRPAATIDQSPPSARTLSASGSRNAPERVAPCLRAR